MNRTITVRPGLRDIPQGRLGMWLLIAGELVIFGAAVVSYLLMRIRYPEWGEQAQYTSTALGALNTFVLLTSSFFVVKAHKASLAKDSKNVVRFLSLTLLCGLIFLIVKGIEYSTEISHGFTLRSPGLVDSGQGVASLFWMYYYLMTGLHGLHVLAGMIAIFVVMLQVRKGKYFHRVELAGMYWHMVDLIWIFLFPLLYILK